MRNINITGRLGKDPELKYTKNGTAVASVNIAVNRERKDADGNLPTDWWRLQLWGKNAENFSNFVHKGSLVGITGRPEIYNWQDGNGNDRQTAQIEVTNFDLLEPRSQNQQPDQTQQNTTNQNQGQPQDPFTANGQGININDSDLPF